MGCATPKGQTLAMDIELPQRYALAQHDSGKTPDAGMPQPDVQDSTVGVGAMAAQPVRIRQQTVLKFQGDLVAVSKGDHDICTTSTLERPLLHTSLQNLRKAL